MPLTLFFAQAIGVFSIVASLSLIFQKKLFIRMIDEMLRSPALLYIVGVIALVLGLPIVLTHDVWNGTFLDVLVTVIGWLIVLKGIFAMLFPSETYGKWVRVLKVNDFTALYGIVLLILGLYLACAGFALN